MGRAHDTNHNRLINDATATGRSSVNTTYVSKLCSATCTEDDSDCIKLYYTAQIDGSSAADGQDDIGMVPADRVDQSRDEGDMTTGRTGLNFDALDRHSFLR